MNFAGKHMEVDRTLLDSNIQEEGVEHLALPRHGNMQILARSAKNT